MKTLIASAAIFSALAAAPAAFAIQPAAIPETGMLEKAPVGSTVTIEGKDQFGNNYQNYFRVQQDGSLEFASQFRSGE